MVTGFYRAVVECPASFCFVAEQGGTLEGFAAGVSHWPTLYRRVVRLTWRLLLAALPALLLSGRWRKLWETGRYTRSRQEGVQAEFLSFGVRPEARGRVWAGAALAYAVIGEFRRRGVPKIRGVVWDQNERALRFFEAVGFRFVSDVEIHPGARSRTFVMDILAARAVPRTSVTPPGHGGA